MDENKSTLIKTDVEFIKKVEKCLFNGVGDDIKEDLLTHRLVTQNSTPSRTWDLINRNLCEVFQANDVVANPIKRGPWKMVPVFERETGIIYSLMRETRFLQLKKERPTRRNAHYVDLFVGALNANLRCTNDQLTLFEMPAFKNQSYIPEIVTKILLDFGLPEGIVKHHALILFNASNYQLTSLRCCIVDRNLDIVEEMDWSGFINVHDSAIVESVTNPTSEFNNPTAGLQLTKKAKDKLGQKQLTSNKKKIQQKDNLE